MTKLPDKRRAALAMGLVFVAGAALGAAVALVLEERLGRGGHRLSPEEYRGLLLEELTEDLDLDASQQASVEVVLDEIGERVREVREAIEPEFEAIRGERADRIMAICDERQKERYRQILEERKKRREALSWQRIRHGGRH